MLLEAKVTWLRRHYSSSAGAAHSALPTVQTVLHSGSPRSPNFFENASYLTTAAIGNSVTSIGDWAFEWSGRTNILILQSIATIRGSGIFQCKYLAAHLVHPYVWVLPFEYRLETEP